MVKRLLKSKVMPWISLLTGLVVTFVILALLVLHTDFFAHGAGRMFSRYFFGGTPFSLRVDKLGGNPLKQLKIEGLSIRYQGVDFAFDVLRIDEIRCKYSLLSLIKGEMQLDEIALIDPHLWIKPDSSGANILPSGGGVGGGLLPQIQVDTFLVQGGQVILQGAERASVLRNIGLKGKLQIQGREIYAYIREGGGDDIGEDLDLRRLKGGIRWIEERKRGEGTASSQSRLFLDEVCVELNESVLTLDGVIDPDSMTFHLKIDAEPLVVEEIARAVEIETSHFGELQGDFIIRGKPEDFRINGIFNGIFSGYALSRLNVDLGFGKSMIRINKCAGGFNGARIEGGGSYTFENPEALSLDLAVKGMNLAEGFIPGRDIPATMFNGRFKLNYNLPEEHILFSFDLDEGHFRGIPFERAFFQGTYGGDSLSLDRISMEHPTHTVISHGSIVGGNTVKFFIDLECTRDDTLFAYLDIEKYRADLDINGIWEGPLDAWNFRASGSSSSFEYENAFVPAGEMKLAINKNDGYSVYFDLMGDSCVIGPVEFSGIDLSLEYREGITSIKRLRVAREGMDVEMWGDVKPLGDLAEITVGEVSLEALEEKWISSGEFSILIGDSTMEFNDLQLHSKLGALYLNCRLNNDRKLIAGDFSFERLGLLLLNRAGIVSVPLDGRCEGTIECNGSLADPDIVVDMCIVGGYIDTVAVDSLQLNASYSGGRLVMDSVVVSSPSGYLAVGGEVAGVTLKDFYRDRRQALRSAVVKLESYCDGLSLEPFLGLADLAPFTGGMFTGTVSLADSLVHPNIVLDGRIRDLAMPDFRIPSVDLHADLVRSNVELEGTIDIMSGKRGEFRGKIPIVEKTWFYTVDGERPLLLDLQLPEGDIEGITRVTEHVAEGEGKFSANFRISGTVDRPNILGELKLKDARFRLAGMEENFYEVNSSIILDDTLITIEEMRGRNGKDGNFRCLGSITLRGWKPIDYDLTVDLDKILLASIPDIIAIMSGQLSVSTDMQDGKAIPMLSGLLEVNRAEIYYDLGDFASDQPLGTMEAPSWIAVIDLDVGGNTWLKTPDASVELRGKVTVHHDQKGTYLRGELNLIRGWYNVYNNKFRVKSGKLEFVRAEGLRPVINIEAETRDPEGRKIFLTLAWLQDDVEPRLALRHEDPGYSETDIWKMLGGGVIGSSGGEGASWDALSTAQNIAANYIERMLNSQMEGITIELESGAATGVTSGVPGDRETMVAIGKYLSEGLYVKYKQGLSISTARQIEVEYRISDLFLIRSEIIRHSEKVLHGKSRRSTDEINVDVKLRWEF